ncbi:zf-HC2 domain-containing protein [Clostridium massiliodielmoense]|uniref:zf-HC2 domain-containing protein n=1 Tax=Clostridium massiliodielmoense TaxID=1776385 RepID=UPI00069EE93A|nr:zf-HC2 domain-containing protein [Clostridium massiliodielmoense]
MNCSIVRDLLPLYEVGLCSDSTKQIIQEHIKSCSECRELFYEMKKSSILQEDTEEINSSDDFSEIKHRLNDDFNDYDREFWTRYYKELYIKGLKIFFSIFLLIILVLAFIKY